MPVSLWWFSCMLATSMFLEYIVVFFVVVSVLSSGGGLFFAFLVGDHCQYLKNQDLINPVCVWKTILLDYTILNYFIFYFFVYISEFLGVPLLLTGHKILFAWVSSSSLCPPSHMEIQAFHRGMKGRKKIDQSQEVFFLGSGCPTSLPIKSSVLRLRLLYDTKSSSCVMILWH